MNVANHIQWAMVLALAQNKNLHKRWNEFHYKFCGLYGWEHHRRQSYIRSDMLLRSLEAAMPSRWGDESIEIDFAFDVLSSFSDYWIYGVYESVRSAMDRARQEDIPRDKLSAFRDRIELVRIPLAKFNFADRRPKSERDRLSVVDLWEGVNSGSYKLKSYRIELDRFIDMQTGSIGWETFDAKAGKSIVISRRSLSDELISLFD